MAALTAKAPLAHTSVLRSNLPVRQLIKPASRAFVSRRPAQTVCSTRKQEDAVLSKAISLPLAAVLAGALLTSAVSPEDARAARSSGRVGGSSFRSAPRSAPRAAPRAAPRGGNTYNTYVAPPLGGYGYGGFGGGISLFPPIYGPPIFGFGLPIGGFFNFVFTMFVISFVFSAIKNVVSGSNDRRRDDDDWD